MNGSPRRRAIGAIAALGLGLASPAAAGEVVVFAAASLQTALDAVAAAWTAETGGAVTIAYAGSPALARQIEAGAPAELFLSADLDWMDHLAARGLIDAGSRRNLLGNRLVLIASETEAAQLAPPPQAEPSPPGREPETAPPGREPEAAPPGRDTEVAPPGREPEAAPPARDTETAPPARPPEAAPVGREPCGTREAPVAIAPGFDLAGMLGDGRLAVADTASVPAGRYARAALETLGLWNGVEGRLAQAENVRAALAFVALGEAPFGIVYATDASVEDAVRVVGAFPPDSHPPIVYPAALTAGTNDPEAAAFLGFLGSDAAGALFEAQGFCVLQGPAAGAHAG